MAKRGGQYPPQYTVPGQKPSEHKAYDPRLQPDQYALRGKVGAKPLRFVPDGLADSGDPAYRRSAEQRQRDRDQLNLSYLGPSDRSISAAHSAIYALFSEDGTPQDIPAEENVIIVGTFPLGYDAETRTYFPDTTGTAGPSTSVSVTNAASAPVPIVAGAGVTLPVSVAGTVTTEISNDPANPVPVVLASGSLPSNVTITNNIATEPVPVANQSGTVLDVAIVGQGGALVVDFTSTQPVSIQNTPNVSVANVVTAQITGTVATTQGGLQEAPGDNVDDSVSVPVNIALLYGREGANTNSPVAVNNIGAILTSSVGTTGVDGTITIDNGTSDPVPTISQDAKQSVGNSLTSQNALVTASALYAQRGINDFRPLSASGTSPTAIDVNVVQTVASGGGGGTVDKVGIRAFSDEVTSNRELGTPVEVGNNLGTAPPISALAVAPPLSASLSTSNISPADNTLLGTITLNPVGRSDNFNGYLFGATVTVEGSTATPDNFAIELVRPGFGGEALTLPVKLGSVGGIDRAKLDAPFKLAQNANYEFRTSGNLTGTGIRVTLTYSYGKVSQT